jgi:alanyl-tRNA synthetase
MLCNAGWSSNRVREEFIKYFTDKREHLYWHSGPVVPFNDPTLLFTNAGMNQFKPLFQGTCDPTLEMSRLTRAVNSQKCIRAGGKHNDLDDVGKDVYHHTYFEMLGNWSFGNYFKAEAIAWSWECLTVTFGLDPERLYVTYFGGDESQGLVPDLEARDLWRKLLPDNRILPFDCKDNFWEMGNVGPCGPCTEIHYDRIGNRDAAEFVNADRPDLMEIWNLVFMQFYRESDGSLKSLPNKHVDTGMGLERLASIMQGKDSNYDTDIFVPIFNEIQRICGCRRYTGLVGAEDIGNFDMAYRVVADHIRGLTFAITDGAVPANDGRGYVLRRILRRAVRYGQEILGAPSGFFAALVPVVVANLSSAFPELLSKQEYVMNVIASEEESFTRTLDQGVKHFKRVVAALQAQGESVVPGKEAHLLFGSMGFPFDLTQLMAEELGMTVDKEAFEELMENDRKISEMSEALRKGCGSRDMTLQAEQTAWLQEKSLPTTDSENKYLWRQTQPAEVLAVFVGRGGDTSGFVESAAGSEGVLGLILDKSPFYYEAGGQIYDMGAISIPGTSNVFTVTNVQAYAGYVVHIGTMEDGHHVHVGASVQCEVDYDRRALVAPNHTLTHVLNFALRKALLPEGCDVSSTGVTVEQKGSLVDCDKMRFDFSWNGALTAEQVAAVEAEVISQVTSKLPVFAEAVPLADATQISSLRAVFGEKYPDPVRVVSVGVSVPTLLADPTNEEWKKYSIEFCGGTHLTNTSEAEDFVLVEETGIAKGIRRIVGYTRGAAAAARSKAAEIMARLAELEAAGPCETTMRLSKEVRVEIDQAMVSMVDKEKMKVVAGVIAESLKVWWKAEAVAKLEGATVTAEATATELLAGGQKVAVVRIDIGSDGKAAKKLQDIMVKAHPEGSFLIVSNDEAGDKVGLYAVVSKAGVAAGVSGVDWCNASILAAGAGKGGGKPNQAMASIPCENAAVFDVIFNAAKEFASKY